MGKLYFGKNNVAAEAEKVYVGVNGVARTVEKMYVGVSGVARQVFPNPRLYLWHPDTGDNSAVTGGWSTGTFYHQTNSGTNYNMTRMTQSIYQSTYLLQGTYSSSDGSSEKAMYAKTTNPINITPYTKLVAIMNRNISRNTNPSDAWFGVFDSQASTGLTCRSSELGTKFLAHKTHSNNKTDGVVHFELEVDVSGITGSYIVLYDNFTPNMNANINVNFSEIYLE